MSSALADPIAAPPAARLLFAARACRQPAKARQGPPHLIKVHHRVAVFDILPGASLRPWSAAGPAEERLQSAWGVRGALQTDSAPLHYQASACRRLL